MTPVKRLNRASYFAGVMVVEGGQMQLWLGQALYAAGRRGDALKLLALKAHPDRDVAKVSKEFVFILKAPELQLDESVARRLRHGQLRRRKPNLKGPRTGP